MRFARATETRTQFVFSQSKTELDRELNVARKICLTRRLAETGAGRIQIRIAELRMIESVKKFCAQLEPGTFAKRKRSNHRQIAKQSIKGCPRKPGRCTGSVLILFANLIRKQDSIVAVVVVEIAALSEGDRAADRP